MSLEDTKMHMSNESLLIILGVGLIAGWLAGQIVQGTGFGMAIINATIGALMLLLIIRLVRGGGGWRGSWRRRW
jgi:uncharacterized membrane protein YeaQ/YmgE (transglycosylase-associated protein family)